MTHRLRRYKAKDEQYRINKIFTSTPGIVYHELHEQAKTGVVPEKRQCEQFLFLWSNPKRRSSVDSKPMKFIRTEIRKAK